MTPEGLSSFLRSFAEKIERSERPSRASVAAELRKLLVTLASGPTKVVVSESWSREDAEAVAAELGGTDLRDDPYGNIGMLIPSENVAQLTEGGDDVNVFNSWLDASGGDPEYEFVPLEG